MQTCDPLHARMRFKFREAVNWTITIVCMAIVFLLLMIFTPILIAFGIALAVSFCLHFIFLDKRAIGIECPHCARYIETNTPWTCPNKGCRNDRVDDFPFIYRCEHCDYYPKGYECHHCRKPIYFSSDRQIAGIAKCANAPAESKPQRVKKDEHEGKLAKKQKDLQLTELDVKQAEQQVKLKGFKDILEPQKPKSVRERLRSRVGGKTELDDEVRKMEAEANEKFKDHPVELEKQLKVIRDEARELL